jgi:glyoxalase family protein
MDFWKSRLAQFNVKAEAAIRFNETYLQFRDPHGLPLEIVERSEGENSEWTSDAISSEHAIKGFGGAVLFSVNPERTMDRLENTLGLQKISEAEDYARFQSESDKGQLIDVKLSHTGQGVQGAGTVHHIAWRTDDLEDQLAWQKHILDAGIRTTEVLDRQYFKSIYYREEGGILFEMATDTPGFATDEEKASLGESLRLPEWLESKRELIKQHLPAVNVPKTWEEKA